MANRAKKDNIANKLMQRKYNRKRKEDKTLPPIEKGWKLA